MVGSFAEGLVCRECVFFFKQKTAYELLRRLVGSEMCIRDRMRMGPTSANSSPARIVFVKSAEQKARLIPCLNELSLIQI